MDPVANLKNQIILANDIQARYDRGEGVDADDAARLAELVLALNAWIKNGGFSPYQEA